MTGRVEGRVALVTGAARGQGRSHAVRLAQEGADIIAVDFCQDLGTAPYSMGTQDDLKETVRLVEETGRRIVARKGDVRSSSDLDAAVSAGMEKFGRLDIVSANAGIVSFGEAHDLSDSQWTEVIDINLSGVWRTAKAATPHIIAGGRGGSIVITSSTAGLRSSPNIGHYVASKHGVVGLMGTLASELGRHNIRVNAICPTQVNTLMLHHDAMYKCFRPDLESPTVEDFTAASQATHQLPVPWVESADISNALLFLVSEDARYVTGAALPVDCGYVL